MKSKNSYELFSNKLKLPEFYNEMPRPIIVADRIQNSDNIGAILRLAGNIGAKLCLFITDEETVLKKSKIDRISSGATKKVDFKFIYEKDLEKFIPEDYSVIAVETEESAKSIYEFELPKKIVFLIGNEIFGIRDSIMSFANDCVYIPIPGAISSLNVTHALSVALFEWLRQNKSQLSS